MSMRQLRTLFHKPYTSDDGFGQTLGTHTQTVPCRFIHASQLKVKFYLAKEAHNASPPTTHGNIILTPIRELNSFSKSIVFR